MKKGFFFRVRRSGFLQGLTMVLFSIMTGAIITGSVAIQVILSYGSQENLVEGLDNFIEWLMEQNMQSERTYSFLLNVRNIAADVVNNEKIYVWIAVLTIVILFMMFCYLMASAGYHGREEEPCLRGMEKIPYDICIPLFFFWTVFLVRGIWEWIYSGFGILGMLSGAAVGCALVIFTVLLFLQITIARIRTGTLFSGTVIVGCLRTVLFFIGKIPLVWRAAALWGGVMAALYISIIFMFQYYAAWYYYASFIYFFWFLVMFALFLAGLWIIIQMDMVRQKAQMLAEGNLELGQDQNQEKGSKELRNKLILPSFKKCLQDLDRISEGMDVIVEEKMKSERFQTELITNVSHDIKTPLTSIINYLDFLSQEEKKENRNAQVVQEYMEVLDRQSVRLKKLIEDLIEASKASTGSLKIEKEPCELGIFLQQIAGEYEERLENAQLALHLVLPEDKVYVEADGRHLWRVIDNLLQNVCKYAMAGTRVYLQLQEKAGQAIIIMKNVSASELNIPAEELMERFVRGDRSRHSEGSGLGLSIARSLTELQGGKFVIEIDGDLFKTAIGFPITSLQQNEGEQLLPEHWQ